MRTPTTVVWGVCILCGSLAAQPRRNHVLEISRSVVQVNAVVRGPDCFQPWQNKTQERWSGTGCVIEGRRVLTNAHVVRDGVYVTVSRSDEGVGYPAKVSYIAHDCDLALLDVPSDDFWKGLKPLLLGDLPQLGDQVAAFGFPIGGSKLSVTNGIVSRIEQITYGRHGMELLAVQIDAAINPGNSGGPVVRDGKIVGIAFQGIKAEKADNIGYAIPTALVRRFIDDAGDHVYDGVPSLGIRWQSMSSRAMRTFHKMGQRSGVLVTAVSFDGSLHGQVHPGDVLLSVNRRAIGNDGMLSDGTGKGYHFEHIITQKQIGDAVDLEALREGNPVAMKCLLRRRAPLVPSWDRHDRTLYYIFGGLVFVSLTQPYMEQLCDGASWNTPAIDELFHHAEVGLPTPERRRVVLLATVLPDDTNFGYHSFCNCIVTKVNGKTIRDLRHLVEVLEDTAPAYHAIELSHGKRVVLDAKKCRDANPRILKQFAIPQDRSPEFTTKTAARTP